ncbi:hypothetical protein PsorP6_017323 [Peronosclerospora sorghi]|uniref:Uncharacterized protein n=1 Tax=Peronosclerospora sorghi TaxID=230839 RepID=A0ACC0WM50_9STRA|nr:hypothetical protein PsorP6_017323 [Peronosclerospora sorghi]
MNYVDKFNAGIRSKYLQIEATVETIKPLTDAFFSTDDQKLVTLIDEASSLQGHEDVVKKLRGYLQDYWVTKGKEPEQVFRLFHLNKITDLETLLKNPKFFEWITYVNNLSAIRKNDTQRKTLKAAIKTLKDQFGATVQEYELLHKTLSGEPETLKLWITSLLQYWVKEDKPPEEVFRWLKLDKQDDWEVLVENPKFDDWLRYLKWFDTLSSVPGRAMEPAVLVLMTHFDEEQAFKIVDKVKYSHEGLLDELLEQWAKKNEKSPEESFRLFGLNEIKNYEVLTYDKECTDYMNWAKYVFKLNAHQIKAGNPEVMTSAFSVLSNQFKDEEQLYNSISLLGASEEWEGYVSVMHAELRKRWLAEGKDPKEVFGLYDSHVIVDLMTREFEKRAI